LLDLKTDYDAASVSVGGRLLANASSSAVVKLWNWDARGLTDEYCFARFMLGAHSVAFSPDGNALASEEILMGSLYLFSRPILGGN
jgi:hypothetical protein